MGFDFSFKTNNDQNRNRYRAEEEKKYDPTFEDDHSEGRATLQFSAKISGNMIRIETPDNVLHEFTPNGTKTK